MLGVVYEPQYSYSRIMLTKLVIFVSLFDDLYDNYSTTEESNIFTAALERYIHLWFFSYNIYRSCTTNGKPNIKSHKWNPLTKHCQQKLPTCNYFTNMIYSQNNQSMYIQFYFIINFTCIPFVKIIYRCMKQYYIPNSNYGSLHSICLCFQTMVNNILLYNILN